MNKEKEGSKYSVVFSEGQLNGLKVLLSRADIKGAEAPALMEMSFLLNTAKPLISEVKKDEIARNIINEGKKKKK